jgi:hypothetical protein
MRRAKAHRSGEKALILFRTGALSPNDSMGLIQERVFHPLAMLGQGVYWQGIGCKIPALAGFFGSREHTSYHATAKCQHNLLFLRLGVYTYQLLHLHL